MQFMSIGGTRIKDNHGNAKQKCADEDRWHGKEAEENTAQPMCQIKDTQETVLKIFAQHQTDDEEHRRQEKDAEECRKEDQEKFMN